MYEVLFEIERLKNEDLENELSKIKKQTKDYKLIKKENKTLKLQLEEAIRYISSFDYYIPEDNKEDLLNILRGKI